MLSNFTPLLYARVILNTMQNHLLTGAVLISAMLYLTCFFYPAISIRGIYGSAILLSGIDLALPTGMYVMGMWVFPWIANIFLILSWAYASSMNVKYCLYLSLVSFVLGLQTLSFNYVGARDKSGSCCLQIDDYHIGYFLWMSSIAVVLFASMTLYLRSRYLREGVASNRTKVG